jgi:hypothetical protein
MGLVPESYGKRQRGAVKAKKAAAREERRMARNQRRADRAAGEEHDWLGEPPERPGPLEAEAEDTPSEGSTEPDEKE